VDVHAELPAPCSPAELFRWVDDLSRYPEWLEIVPRAEADGDDAWVVDLRGRLGPLARSKRLRMVRTDRVADRSVRFERQERDGRQHAPWILEADVTATPDGSRLAMDLHYGGSFGGRLLERMLRDEIDKSRPRLLALVTPP
jgi:hypothetical protein